MTVSRLVPDGALDRDLDEPPRYKPRPPVPRKLDPYRGIIQAHLEAYPKLSSVWLLAEIQAVSRTVEWRPRDRRISTTWVTR